MSIERAAGECYTGLYYERNGRASLGSEVLEAAGSRRGERKRMKILLVRHGETDWNVAKRIQGCTDIPLNETGIRQAEKLAEVLAERDVPIRGIYTSKLKRAADTARIAAERLGKEWSVLEGIEEINFGLWEGCSWEEVAEKFPAEYQAWRKNRRYENPPQGESYQKLLERVMGALQKLLKELQEENGETADEGDIVIVTHSADIMTLLSFIYDTPFYEMVKRYKTENAAVIEIEPEVIEQAEM